MKARGKSFYDDLSNTLNQHIRNCFPNIDIWRAGSRGRNDFRRTSDLDLQFCVNGGPTTRADFYSRLIDCIKNNISNFRGELIQVKLGGSGNVVNVFPSGGGKISYALEPCP